MIELTLAAEHRERAADGAKEQFRRCLGKQKPGPAIFYSVGKPPGSMPDRQRTKTLRIHLAQTARLEAGRHHGEIAARKNAPGCRIIEPYRDTYRTAVRLAGFDKRRFEPGLPPPHHYDLATRGDNGLGRR